MAGDRVFETLGDPHSGGPTDGYGCVERELRQVDPTAAIENPKTLAQIRDDSLASRTFAMQLLVGFAVVGSMLTLVGIYGVLALSVASRSRELGIRVAVGAQQKDIRNLIFGEGFRLIAGGVFAGVALAVVFSRVLRTFLFEVQPNDPMTLIVIRGSGTARMLGAGAASCKGRPAKGVTLRMSCIAEERPSRERSVPVGLGANSAGYQNEGHRIRR